MSLRVYNTLTKQKELFHPVRPGKVGIYLCGPTVYKSPHIGHMVGPVIFDAIKRYLVYKGFEVTWVVNVTDVDDKIIERAGIERVGTEELSAKFTQEYFDCLTAFGVDTIDRFPKASEHMDDIIALCERLIAGDYAYAVDGNVWFDVARDADYGKLSNRKLEQQESGLRTLEGAGKRNPADFALWKSAKPGEPSWPSPWGEGRPGWHIECSAMSMKYLGETFDMHGGGMDLMFPHHENELAQSESATGKPLSRFWMHNGLTRIKTKLASGEVRDEKMSGSLGNVISARELVQKHGAELMRYMLLSTHYRRPIEFTDEVLATTRKGLGVFARLFERIERIGGRPQLESTPDLNESASALIEGEFEPLVRSVLGLKMKFLEMMDDDFNTAGAIAVLHEAAGEINAFVERARLERTHAEAGVKAAEAATQTLRRLGQLLGLFRTRLNIGGEVGGQLADDLMGLIISLRQTARKNKDFATADAIRDGLAAISITLEDRPGGTGWRKV